jgi:hypothetical protein
MENGVLTAGQSVAGHRDNNTKPLKTM